jgi:hypothetical protein
LADCQVSHLTHLLSSSPPLPPRDGPGNKQAAKAYRTLQVSNRWRGSSCVRTPRYLQVYNMGALMFRGRKIGRLPRRTAPSR